MQSSAGLERRCLAMPLTGTEKVETEVSCRSGVAKKAPRTERASFTGPVTLYLRSGDSHRLRYYLTVQGVDEL
jgi:hypothetical protein